MEEMTINAVEMVRKIRDASYERLAAMSVEERIAYYRQRAKRLNEKAGKMMKKPAGTHTAFPLVKAKRGTRVFELESEDAALVREDEANVLTE